MKITNQKNWLIALVMILSGCANPINERTATQYYNAGINAEKAGELDLARENYSRAYQNAVMGNLGPREEAYALYEWSRISGYLCHPKESREGFEEVLSIIGRQGKGIEELKAPCLSELARLLHDTGNHPDAVYYYAVAAIELEKVGIVKSDPIGYAQFLDEYQQSLEEIGSERLASEIGDKARRLREDYAARSQGFTPRRYCPGEAAGGEATR